MRITKATIFISIRWTYPPNTRDCINALGRSNANISISVRWSCPLNTPLLRSNDKFKCNDFNFCSVVISSKCTLPDTTCSSGWASSLTYQSLVQCEVCIGVQSPSKFQSQMGFIRWGNVPPTSLIYIYIRLCVCACLRACVRVHVRVCVCVFVCACVRARVRVYVPMCVCSAQLVCCIMNFICTT